MRIYDNTWGSGMLETIALNQHKNKSVEEQFIDNAYVEHFKNEYHFDWLLQYLASYGLNIYSKGDLLYYRKLHDMILSGGLYMTLFDLDNFAFPDKQQEDNVNNLKKVMDIDVERCGGNSDGVFFIENKVELKKIYPTDDSTPSIITDTLTVENFSGICEFGTQNLCKSVASLIKGDYLLRVPYESSMIPTPKAIIFKYINKKITFN